MKRISIILGMCVVAVVAFSAIGAASAFAEEPMPYLFQFQGGGTAAGGTFTSTGGVAKLKTAAATVECESNTNGGKFGDAHLGTVTIIFHKCKTSGINCGNEGSNENITLNKWGFHLVAGFDPELGRWIPAILVLLKENGTNKAGEFKFVCGGIITVTVKGIGVTGALYKHGTTEPLNLGEAVASADLVFKGEKASEFKLLFSEEFFPLSKEKVLSPSFESETSITKKLEPAEQESTDTLEKFKNSAGETKSIELVE